MKYLKLFLVAIVALVVSSCNDDKTSWNTESDVYVEMAQTTFFTKEGRRLARVPFNVVGDANGRIQVKFKVEEAGTDYPESAIDDVHYYVTTKTVNIDSDDKQGYFEFTIVNDRVINDPRSFIVTIESAEGALVGQVSQCVVSIRDNDSDPYDRMGGIWRMTYLDSDEVEGQVDVEIEPYMEEDEFLYHNILPMEGNFFGAPADMRLKYITNSQGQGVAVGIMGGSSMIIANFGDFGECEITTGFTAAGGFTEKGFIEGHWNEDFTEVVFDGILYFGVTTTQNNTTEYGANVFIGTYDAWHDIKLTFIRDIS